MSLICETKWHGNPRPWPSYFWTEYDGSVLSPYTDQLVPVHVHGLTDVPYAEKDDPPSGSIDVAGPAATASFSLAGPFPAGTQLEIAGTRAGGTVGAFGDSITLTRDMSPEEAAALWGLRLRGNDEMTTEVDANSRTVVLVALSPTTTITISSLIITPPA